MPDINYPTLSGLTNINQLPESLYFFHEGLSSFLSKIFYRKYRVIRSKDGATYSIFIELLSAKANTWSKGSVNTHDPKHYFSFENKACLVEKMKNFTLFWLNRIIYPSDTGLCMIWRKDPKDNIITAFDQSVIAYPGSKTEDAAFGILVDYILNNHLLPYLKTSLTNEQVGKQVV